MSKSLFTLITAGEMDSLLSKGGFARVEVEGTKEYVYDRPFNTLPNVVIRVYTSIDSLLSREIGKDAIRIVLFDKKANKAIGKADTKTYRIVGWQDRLISKIKDVFFSVQYLKKCPCCKSFLVERKGKNYHFHGCSSFPLCNYKENIK